MNEPKLTPRWYFEAHALYGTPVFEEGDAPWPFGYISSEPGRPIFELAPVLTFPVEELTAYARLMAAAPDLAEALDAAKVVIAMMERPEGMGDEVNAALDARLAKIDAALSKAKGPTT